VKSLSGGERNRLLLARLFARPTNVLVLDEPTNDLDIPTLELLEELLDEYDGTVLLVSHDRAFLDNVATSILAAEGAGRWREYVGGFSDWQTQAARAAEIAPSDGKKSEEKNSGSGARATPNDTSRSPAPRPAKLSFKEQRELDALPQRIAELEAEQQQAVATLADGRIYAQDPQQAASLNQRCAEIEAALQALLVRWESLESKMAGK
jgi:ATP-binding cassette subfamily F protein uup